MFTRNLYEAQNVELHILHSTSWQIYVHRKDTNVIVDAVQGMSRITHSLICRISASRAVVHHVAVYRHLLRAGMSRCNGC